MKINGVSRVREIELFIKKSEEKKLKVKLEYRGNLLEKIKIEEEKKRVRKNNRVKGGGATERRRIDFLV